MTRQEFEKELSARNVKNLRCKCTHKRLIDDGHIDCYTVFFTVNNVEKRFAFERVYVDNKYHSTRREPIFIDSPDSPISFLADSIEEILEYFGEPMSEFESKAISKLVPIGKKMDKFCEGIKDCNRKINELEKKMSKVVKLTRMVNELIDQHKLELSENIEELEVKKDISELEKKYTDKISKKRKYLQTYEQIPKKKQKN